ncbi:MULTISPECIES: hypothetical protein [Pseudomonas]|uniref:Tox-PLDMTX domain-containing protein n=1 Tax=Pseudomonas wuhanensis TaxID=2954098 RepID=A0ABY9GL56_9PSED|nr:MULTISPECIES: hypothetical protein [unclassified Pseudomonas]WLI10678.1 hypothetical protein PSH65_20810 [Pseudomonas sp. FP603]WLI16494.1 hypothetical protein PSH88_19435 [Pseudomonas sp. FP607]
MKINTSSSVALMAVVQESQAKKLPDSDRPASPVSNVDKFENAVFKPGKSVPENFEVVSHLSKYDHVQKVVRQRSPENHSVFQVTDPDTGVSWPFEEDFLAENDFSTGKPQFVAGREVWMRAADTGLQGGAEISNAQDLQSYICENDQITTMIDSPRGKCHDCAVIVQNLLDEKNIKHFTRAMYIWKSQSDNCPATHYVVVAKLDKNVAIDPTGSQFAGVDAAIENLDTWAEDFRSAFGQSTIIKFNDYATLADSRGAVNVYFEGKPNSFSGKTMQN